ncbi:MAG: hypothetical protein GF388_05715, partial [Candidatus Aegiribacteria sp.]|nr:hypothetical protein [Candidatus Aegiribacteria sp.]
MILLRFILCISLSGIPVSTTSTAERLFIDGSLQQAETVLESLEELEPEAGFLLEMIHQTEKYYDLNLYQALDLVEEITGTAADAPWLLDRLTSLDTLRIDGELRYSSIRVRLIALGMISPFPQPPRTSISVQE